MKTLPLFLILAVSLTFSLSVNLGVNLSAASSLTAAESSPIASQSITGRVTLDTTLAKSVTPGAVLYIIARKQGETKGMPLAVARIEKPTFPQEFKLGPENVMVAGNEFKGLLTVTAKISQRGDAMTRPGDLIGQSKSKVTPGSSKVEIQISETTK